MTKTEKRKMINKSVFEYINEHYPELIIDDYGDGGRVSIYDPSAKTSDDSIEYSRSNHSFCTLNWANDKMKRIEEVLEAHVETLMRMYELS